MYVVTAEEMRRIDEATIGSVVPGLTLMERAGRGVFDRIAADFRSLDDLAVSIFLGRGNNAGDGLVLARLLAENGAKVMLHYLHEPKDLSPDAFKNYTRLKNLRRNKAMEENFLYLADWEQKVIKALGGTDLIVDALLGTGISKPVNEFYSKIIEMINESGLLVLGMDVPSGVNATTGEIMGTAVRADLTVMMGLPKIGCFFYPGKSHTGGFQVVDIGIPPEIIERETVNLRLLNLFQAMDDLPERDPSAHKFRCGSLLLVAGSRRYTGAAQLAAVAALRTGCGIVYLAGPESIRPVIQASAHEVIFLPQRETESGSISHSSIETILEEVRFDAAAIRPGLTTDDDTAGLTREFVARCPVPLLIDADGINAFAGGYKELVKASKEKEIVISPHSGEFKRLTGDEIPDIPLKRINRLLEHVKGTGITLVHKGAPTVIAQPDGTGYVNSGGHPGQATAGSGDVLTGAIGGLLAQGCGAHRAARLGVYLHSQAAQIAAEDFSKRGMIASDCLNALGRAMKELEED